MVAVVVAVIAPVAVEAQPWAVARGVLLASNVDSQRLAVHPVPLHACRPTPQATGREVYGFSQRDHSVRCMWVSICAASAQHGSDTDLTKQHLDKKHGSYPQTAARAHR